MKKERFEELVESVKEAAAISRGEARPARAWEVKKVAGPDGEKIVRRQMDVRKEFPLRKGVRKSSGKVKSVQEVKTTASRRTVANPVKQQIGADPAYAMLNNFHPELVAQMQAVFETAQDDRQREYVADLIKATADSLLQKLASDVKPAA